MTESELRQASHVLAWICERLQALPESSPRAVQVHASCRLADRVLRAFADQLGRGEAFDDASCAAALARVRIEPVSPKDVPPA